MSQPGDWNRLALSIVFAIATAGLVAGWWLFWFLCDDAYIAFRYVHHFVAGNGLVWNPAPFAPVEGYTSFLWVTLLGAIWSVTGFLPTQSANLLLLLFSIGSLAWVVCMVGALSLSDRLRGVRLWLLVAVLFGTISNRTFLAWTSSGLEQGMFSFFLLGWVYVGLFRPLDPRGFLQLACLSVALTLVRPDGLLFAAVTGGLLSWATFWRVRTQGLQAADVAPFLPFLVPLFHVVWRRSYYGEWLPNTYYAKYVAAWPEAGLRYLASFALEYAYYLWIPLLALAALRVWRAGGPKEDGDAVARRLQVGAVLFALAAHFAYYTFRVGGDHFEYRVYHHLVPLLLLLLVWAVDRAEFRAPAALASLVLCIGMGLVLPWTHYAATHNLQGLRENGLPHVRIAALFPEPIRVWPETFDSLQRWLIKQRAIGVRHQTHKLFVSRVQQTRFPSRSDAVEIDFGSDLPVMLHRAIGYPGWAMPNLVIIDGLGLNDAVIARNPVVSEFRRMAHDRSPPAGYVACFEANVFIEEQRVTVNERRAPLTAARVRACEERFRKQVDRLQRLSPETPQS